MAVPLAALVLAPAAKAAEPSALQLVQTIDLKGKAGGLDHLAIDLKRDRLFLANKINGTVDVVDLKAGKLLQQIPRQAGAQGVAFAPDLDRVFVGLGIRGFCNIFTGEDYKLLNSIKFEDDADNVRYNAATHLAYIAHAEKAIGVVDGKTLEQKADIKLPGTAEGFQIEARRPRMYVAIPTPSQVAVVDTDKNEVIKSFPLQMAGGVHPVALDEPSHRLFLGCRLKSPSVVVMDSETGQEVAGIPIPQDVDDLFYDANRKQLYASCGEGFIVVIKQQNANQYQVVEKVATVKGAKTSLFVPDANRLYLAVPRQERKEGPEIRVYQVKP
jgi:DNA-binding beta-propeller fold protein YncE